VCARRARLVVLAWVCVAAVVGVSWITFGARTSNDIRLPGTETQAATDFLTKEFPPQQNGQSPVVFHVATGTLEDPAVKRAVEASVRRIAGTAHVESVTSPYTKGARGMLLSEDAKTGLAQVLLDVNGGAVTRAIAADVVAAARPARDAGVQV
jgi:putative drug exporter of the RND superfamily